MTKQEFILSALDLFPDREMGWGIRAMVTNNQLNEHTINVLVVLLKRGIDSLNAVVKEYKMDVTVQAVDSLNERKEQQKQQDQEDLSKLDSMIDNFTA